MYTPQMYEIWDTIEQLKRNQSLQKTIIDEYYKSNGKHWLQALSDRLNSENGFEENSEAKIWADKILMELDANEKRNQDKVELEIKNMKRQARFFYPLLILSFITTGYSIADQFFTKPEINKEIIDEINLKIDSLLKK